MQWRRRRRTFYVIGSAKHALLIKHYPLFSSGGGSGNEDEGGSSTGIPGADSRGNFRRRDRKLVHTETHIFNDEEYTKIQTPRQDLLFKKGYLSRPKKSELQSEETPSSEDGHIVLIDSQSIEDSYGEDEDAEEEEETPEETPTEQPAPDAACPENGQVYMEQYCYVDPNGAYYTTDVPVAYMDSSYGAPPPVYAPPTQGGVMMQPSYVVTYPMQWTTLRLQPLEWYNPRPPPSEAQYYYAISNQATSLQPPPNPPEDASPAASPEETPSCQEGNVDVPREHISSPPPTSPSQKPNRKSPSREEKAVTSEKSPYLYPGYAFGASMNCTHGALRVTSPSPCPGSEVVPDPSPPLTPAEDKRKRKRKKKHKKKNSDKIVSNPENCEKSYEEVVKQSPAAASYNHQEEDSSQLLLEPHQKESMETNQLLLESQQMLQMEETSRQHPDPDEKDSAYEKSISSPETLEPPELEDRHYDVHVEMNKEKGIEPDEGIEYGAHSDENGHASSEKTTSGGHSEEEEEEDDEEESDTLPSSSSLPTLCSSLDDHSSNSLPIDTQPVLSQDNPLPSLGTEKAETRGDVKAERVDSPIKVDSPATMASTTSSSSSSRNSSVESDIIYESLSVTSTSSAREQKKLVESIQKDSDSGSASSLVTLDQEPLQEVQIQSGEHRKVLLTQETDSETDKDIDQEDSRSESQIPDSELEANQTGEENESSLENESDEESIAQTETKLLEPTSFQEQPSILPTETACEAKETSVIMQGSMGVPQEHKEAEVKSMVSFLEKDERDEERRACLQSKDMCHEGSGISNAKEECIEPREAIRQEKQKFNMDSQCSMQEDAKICISLPEADDTEPKAVVCVKEEKDEVEEVSFQLETVKVEEVPQSVKQIAEELVGDVLDKAIMIANLKRSSKFEEFSEAVMNETHDDVTFHASSVRLEETADDTFHTAQLHQKSMEELPSCSSKDNQATPRCSTPLSVESSEQERPILMAVEKWLATQSLDQTFNTNTSLTTKDFNDSEEEDEMADEGDSIVTQPKNVLVNSLLAPSSKCSLATGASTVSHASIDSMDGVRGRVGFSMSYQPSNILGLLSRSLSEDENDQEIYSPMKYSNYYHLGAGIDEDSSSKSEEDDIFDIDLDLQSPDALQDSQFSIPPPFSTPSTKLKGLKKEDKPEGVNVPPSVDSELQTFQFTRPDSEIVVHTASDAESECGSEDVDLLTHRYDTATPAANSNNKLSLAAEIVQVDGTSYQKELKLIPSEQSLPVVMTQEDIKVTKTLDKQTTLAFEPQYGNKDILENHYGNKPRTETYDSGISSDDSGDEFAAAAAAAESYLKHRIQGISYQDISPANSLIFRTLSEEGSVPCGVCCVIQ